MSEISILIADDHNLVREGIRSLIEATENMVVASEAGKLGEVLERVKETSPDVVLLDIYFPEGSSFSVCRTIKSQYPKTKVIFLTGMSDPKTVEESIISEGDGFLLKGVKFKQFTAAIRDVLAGKSVIDQSIMDGGDS